MSLRSELILYFSYRVKKVFFTTLIVLIILGFVGIIVVKRNLETVLDIPICIPFDECDPTCSVYPVRTTELAITF